MIRGAALGSIRHFGVPALVLVSSCNVILSIERHELAPDASAGSSGTAGTDADVDAGLGGGAGVGSGGAGFDAADVEVGDGGCLPAAGYPLADGSSALVTLASGQLNPSVVVVTGSFAYFIESGDATNKPTIKSAPMDGSGPVKVLASDLANPKSLRFVGANPLEAVVHFTDDLDQNGNGVPGVYRIPKPGGFTEPVAIDQWRAGAMVQSPAALYSEAWAPNDFARVRRVDPSGLVNTCYPYVSPISGGRIPELWVDIQEAKVYAIDSAANSIVRFDSASCETTATTFKSNVGPARAITGSKQAIYWITADTLYRLDKDKPDGVPVVLLCGQNELSNVELNGTDANGYTLAVTSASDGRVLRINPATLATDQIGVGQNQPLGLRVTTSGHVVWTNLAGGNVVRFSPL